MGICPLFIRIQQGKLIRRIKMMGHREDWGYHSISRSEQEREKSIAGFSGFLQNYQHKYHFLLLAARMCLWLSAFL